MLSELDKESGIQHEVSLHKLDYLAYVDDHGAARQLSLLQHHLEMAGLHINASLKIVTRGKKGKFYADILQKQAADLYNAISRKGLASHPCHPSDSRWLHDPKYAVTPDSF